METSYGTKKNAVVVVFDGDACLTDILREIVITKGPAADVAASISAIGFADPSQIKEIVKIIDRPKTMSQ